MEHGVSSKDPLGSILSTQLM